MNLALNNSRAILDWASGAVRELRAFAFAVAIQVVRAEGGPIEGDTDPVNERDRGARYTAAVRVLSGRADYTDLLQRFILADAEFGAIFVPDENGSMGQPTDQQIFDVTRRVWTEVARLPSAR